MHKKYKKVVGQIICIFHDYIIVLKLILNSV